jgi:hypothetical protein
MTQQTNTNPAIHGDVLGLVNDNANDAESRLSAIEGAAIMEGVLETFYLDWATGAAMAESDTTSPSGDIVKDTRVSLPINTITTSNGDSLDEYHIQAVLLQFYDDSANAGWSAVEGSKVSSATGNLGAMAHHFSDQIVVQTANYKLVAKNTVSLGAWGNADAIDAAPCRVQIKAVRRAL